MHEKFGIATRFYGLSEVDVERLRTWIDAALTIVSAEDIFIAIKTESDCTNSLDFLKKNYPEVRAFPVTPWGKVVQAPNAIVLKVAEQKVNYLLFVSTEYPVTEQIKSLLMSHCDENTLVVGAALSGHDMQSPPGESKIVKNASGLQIPWNTCALWSLDRLIHTGFVLAADSLHDPDNAGMEEMGTIAAQQILWPGKALAKLVMPRPTDIAFNIHGWSAERHERYLQNLTSKTSRSASQMQRLSIPTPEVFHIGMKNKTSI